MAKILLADDSGTAQRMGAQILSAEGHEVSTVSNGQAAIKILDKFAPDLIVADVFMPGKTGYELCEFIKSDPDSSWIPVLLIVAPMEPYDATEGKRVKADGLVTKPLDKSNLVETVQALLASSKRPAAAPKKRSAKAVAAPEPATPPEPAVLESHADDDPTIPAISTTTATAEIKIPEEMRNQPVSLVGELLEPERAETEPPADEVLIEHEGIERELSSEETAAESSPLISLVENDSPEITQDPLLVSGTDQIEPEGIARLFAEAEKFEQRTPIPHDAEPDFPAVSSEDLPAPPEIDAPEPPQASETEAPAIAPAAFPASTVSWSAARVDVLDEDRKLFGAELPDWQGLVNLVQEADQLGQFPAVSSAVAPPPPPEPAAPSAPEVPELPSENAPDEEREAAPATPASSSTAADAGPAVESAVAADQGAASHPEPKPDAPPALSDTVSMMVPQVAPLDYATVEQIVRETVEAMMPQIVDRIAQATGLSFPKNEPPPD